MKIVITGSLGNISKPLTQMLVKKNHLVTVISSRQERQTDIEKLGAVAAIGTMTDAAIWALNILNLSANCLKIKQTSRLRSFGLHLTKMVISPHS